MAIPDIQVTPAEVREIVLRELRNSDLAVLVRQLQGSAKGSGWTSGTGTLTFTASVDSAVLTVTHGLGRTPAQVLTSIGDSIVSWAVISTFNRTSTTFQASAHDVDGTAHTGTNSFHWLAVV